MRRESETVSVNDASTTRLDHLSIPTPYVIIGVTASIGCDVDTDSMITKFKPQLAHTASFTLPSRRRRDQDALAHYSDRRQVPPDRV